MKKTNCLPKRQQCSNKNSYHWISLGTPQEQKCFIYSFSFLIALQNGVKLHFQIHRLQLKCPAEEKSVILITSVDSSQWSNDSVTFYQVNVATKYCPQVLGNIVSRTEFQIGFWISMKILIKPYKTKRFLLSCSNTN